MITLTKKFRLTKTIAEQYGKPKRTLRKKSCGMPYTKNTDTLPNEFNYFFISAGERAARESAVLARSPGLLDYDASYTNSTSEPGEPSFTFGFIISDIDRLILALKFRFGAILV